MTLPYRRIYVKTENKLLWEILEIPSSGLSWNQRTCLLRCKTKLLLKILEVASSGVIWNQLTCCSQMRTYFIYSSSTTYPRLHSLEYGRVMNCEVYGTKFAPRHYPHNSLGGIEKNNEKLSYDNRWPGWESNRTPPVYKSERLLHDLIFPVVRERGNGILSLMKIVYLGCSLYRSGPSKLTPVRGHIVVCLDLPTWGQHCENIFALLSTCWIKYLPRQRC
jgi:hypothetical protein